MSHCGIAFKEWGVIVAALAGGRQTIILRKGGIHEGRDGFRVAHHRFWLLPTRFHASSDALISDAVPFMTAAQSLHENSTFMVQYLAQVDQVIALSSQEQALSLAGLHLWSEATVRQRFHYKQPGLYCLITRIYAAPTITQVKETPQIAGCRSWVDLPDGLSIDTLTPVIDDTTYQRMVDEVLRRAN